MHGITFAPFLLAAATLDTKGLEISGFTIGWFDGVVVLILVAGLFRGRHRGMSAELMDLILWLAIVLVGGFCHASLGRILADITKMDMLKCNIAAYLGIAAFLGIVFMMLKHGVGEKLVGSDAFGNLEYYLGMGSGMVRFFCMMLAFMAVLNARLYTNEELTSQLNYQQKELGNVYFPTVAMVQKNVFQQSFVGKLVKDNVSMLLVTPTLPATGRESLGHRREKEIDDVIGIK